MATILIADDDRAFRSGLRETLSDLGCKVIEAASGIEALRKLQEQAIDLAFLDFRMSGLDGLETLKRMRAAHEELPVVLLTAYATSANTIEAMKLGAFDHLVKPIGRADIERILSRALVIPTAPQPEASGDAFIATTGTMREVLKAIGMAAASEATVLISGETGTGKEMVARALHQNSARAARPLVAVNCAALPEALLESELFGHVKGAFTGAASERLGRFQQADGGTLMLDEVGDMSLAMQAKILRVLQEREITSVGSNRVERVNVRIVAATHRDLHEGVRAGTFREDLLYRLSVVPIHLPPLRDRPGDIVALAEHFLQQSTAPKTLSPQAARVLLNHRWPGNIRELKNAMERVAVLVRAPTIEPDDLSFLRIDGTPEDTPDTSLTLPEALARLEQRMIRAALDEAQGNRADAARRLGIRRQMLYTKMKEHGIE